jgi:hypothetical protein
MQPAGVSAVQTDDGQGRNGERRMKARIFHGLTVCALLCAGCLFQPEERVSGGGSSETTNGVVVGRVTNPDGSPAVGARVELNRRSYLKESAVAKAVRLTAVTKTDEAGRFQIDSVDPGDYFLEANDSGRSGTLYEFSTGDRDTFVLESKTMRPTGTVTGTIAIDSGRLGDATVQIYGLDRLAHVDASGRFAFTDLPEGSYTFRAQLTGTAADPRIIPGVQSVSADTTDIGRLELASFEAEDYASWTHASRFVLNTTASGANVKGDVADFALLVRLNALNFDFTQSDGRDIRFEDGRGRRLRYQVERWDALNRQAEVWVKLDTVHGDSRQDLVTLYWGKPGAPDWSDGRQVFDTAAGYAGVWHLAEEAADTVSNGIYEDATPAAQNGDDRIAATGTDGIVGLGHHLDFGDRIRATPSASLRPAKFILVSGWFRGDTTDNGGSTVAGLGDSYGLRVDKGGNVRFFTSKGKGKGWHELNTKGVNVLDSAWHQLVGVHSGTALEVYIDGVLKGKMAAAVDIMYNLGPDFYIGRHGNGKVSYDLKGDLDEINVVDHPRGADYIKLTFESQRLNPTLVEFLP